MKEGFTFNQTSLKFLKKFTFKNFGGGENRKEPFHAPYTKTTFKLEKGSCAKERNWYGYQYLEDCL